MLEQSRVRSLVEIAALLVGLVLGINTLWQSLRPTLPLVADLLVTPARLPVELVRSAHDLPQRLSETLASDEALRKLLPAEATRRQVAAAAKNVTGRFAESFTSPLVLRDNLLVVTVFNTGSTTLTDVQLSFRHWMNGPVTIRYADRSEKHVECTGLISLGDMRPQASIQIFAWGLGVLSAAPPDVLLTHKEGVGTIRTVAFVPPAIGQHGGIFFSYRHTTVFLLAVLLLVGGALGLARLRRRPTSRASH